MIKQVSLFFTIMVSCFILFACAKSNDHGSVYVAVKHNGQIATQPMVYMKSGTLSNPGIPISMYEKSMSGDGLGQITFENLDAGNYYFYAKVNLPSGSFSGGNAVTVKSKYRDNSYYLTINTN